MGLRRRGLFWVGISGKVECLGANVTYHRKNRRNNVEELCVVPTLVES